jgi:hypothetical protein
MSEIQSFITAELAKCEAAGGIAYSDAASQRVKYANVLKALEKAVDALEHDFRCSLPSEVFREGKPECARCIAITEIRRILLEGGKNEHHK